MVRPANRYSLVSVQNGILAAAYLVPSLVSGVLVEQLSPDLTWRAAYLFGLLPLLVFVPVLLWLPESPRWLIAKGRLDDAERVIEKMEDEAGLDHDRALRTEVGWSGDDAVALTPAGEATGEPTDGPTAGRRPRRSRRCCRAATGSAAWSRSPPTAPGSSTGT